MPAKVYRKVFKFKGGHLALDFCNTVHWHKRPQPVELIETYAQLVEWGKRAGTLTARAAAQLLRAAATRPHAAETARRTAIELRESLYRLFAAHAHRRTPSTADLESLNRYLATASARLHLARDGEGYRWGYARDERALDRMLWPVVEEAADLLTSPGLQRVGQCADERGCGWLFLDTTKNHSRRYCATGDCGAINKARRYYRRQRAVAQ